MKMKMLISGSMGMLLFFTSCKKDKENNPEPPVIQHARIDAISPSSGPKNTVVTISGKYFGTSTTAVSVYFNNVQAGVQSLNDSVITVTVPVNAGTGTVKVVKSGATVTGPSFDYFVTGQVRTYTGAEAAFNDGSLADARFYNPIGIVKDAAGNIFVCDRDNHRIRKITPAGVVSTFAGGTMGFTDGNGAAARFNQPYCITMDASGNMYVGDRMNHSIRKITPAAVVTTLAGNGTAGDAPGTGSAARFNEPLGIAADPVSGNIFVADYINQKIKKVTPAGVVTDFYGLNCFGLTFDAAGNLFVTEYGDMRISKITASGVRSDVAGTYGTSGTIDGTGTAARFNFPAGITCDPSGNLYVCDAFNNRIRKITPAGVVTTLAGSSAGETDGIGNGASFNTPLGLCGDYSHNVLYVADFSNNRIRRVYID